MEDFLLVGAAVEPTKNPRVLIHRTLVGENDRPFHAGGDGDWKYHALLSFQIVNPKT